MKEENLCVLIDFENIAAGTEKAKLGRFNIRLVMNRLKEKGRILVTRAYGDWGRFAKFKQSLLEQGVSMMELTSYRGQDKNRADIALVVDAMELAYTREYITTFVLLSGDSDFTPLAMRLKELNKRVIGLGTKGSTSRLLSESCDEFIFYESLLRNSKTSDPAQDENLPKTKKEAIDILVQTIEGIQKDKPGPVSVGFLKQSIMRKYPTFDEGEYGFSNFTAFLKEIQKNKKIVLLKDPRSQGFQIDMYQSEIDDIQLPEVPDMSIEARSLWDKLIDLKLNPTSHMIRHTVVHELVDHVTERMAKKKRNSLKYVYSDIQRRCRKTDPPISATDVRHVITATKVAGLLLHPNGDPVRSENAQFIIKHDAEALLVQLREYYIQQLLNSGQELQNSSALSELLWGDKEHAEEAMEIVSWLKFEDSNLVQAQPIAQSQPPQAKKENIPVEDANPPAEAVEETEHAKEEDSSTQKSTKTEAAKKRKASKATTANKSAAKTTTKKTAAKKTTKKTTTKKASTKKPATKKSSAKKSAVKKPAAKKTVVKKATTKKEPPPKKPESDE